MTLAAGSSTSVQVFVTFPFAEAREVIDPENEDYPLYVN